jgi:hypothetical protein
VAPVTPPPRRPRRPAYLIADFIVSIVLLGAAAIAVLRALMALHHVWVLPDVLLWLLVCTVWVLTSFGAYHKAEYLRIALPRSRRYWKPERKEQP